MSTVALESREARRPSWPMTFGAVIGASTLAWPLCLLWLFPLGMLGLVPAPSRDRAGHGWPWRIDGLWSFAADIGPLLLCGIVFAWSFEAILGRFSGSRRQPSLVLALVAAAVGWLSLTSPERAGLIPVDTFIAFVVVVLVARSVRHRPGLRLTRRGVAVAVAAGLALTAASVSYGLTHPLSAENGDQASDSLSFALRNDTRFDARLLSVTVPGRGSTELSDWEGRTLVGMRIDGMGSEFLTLKTPRCVTIERLDVRLTVAGREIRQRVWLDQSVVVPCR